MKNFIQLIVLTVLTALLTACGGGHQEPKLSIKNMNDLQSRGKAVVVLSSQSSTLATYGAVLKGGMDTSWSPKDKKSAFDFKNLLMTTAYNTKDTPKIAELRPGTYNLLEFHYTSSNIKTSNAAGMRGLPLASFNVKAGEVVYLGNIRVHTITKLFGSSKGFDLLIENDQARARAYLAKQAPELAAKMKTRLIKISPLFNALKKIAAKKK